MANNYTYVLKNDDAPAYGTLSGSAEASFGAQYTEKACLYPDCACESVCPVSAEDLAATLAQASASLAAAVLILSGLLED